MEGASRSWLNELKHLIDFNHGFLDDLMSWGLLEDEDRVEELEAKSPSPVQRDRLLKLMVEQSPTGILQFLEALRITNQEHVANFITRNGCKYIVPFICSYFCEEMSLMLSTISPHLPLLVKLPKLHLDYTRGL